jgi:TetR/AcrR family transcriptional regulator, regulator of mycofactocin system
MTLMTIIDESSILNAAMTTESLRQRHIDRTRNTIAEAALALFKERGFAATTIEDIARRADVAPRTFFRYFPTKEAVLFDGSEHKLASIRERLLQRPKNEPAAESLFAVLGEITEEFSADRERAELLCSLATETKNLLASQRSGMMEQFSSTVIDALAERTGTSQSDVALRSMVSAVVACFASVCQSWIDDGAPEDLQRYMDRALAACRQAFG